MEGEGVLVEVILVVGDSWEGKKGKKKRNTATKHENRTEFSL